MVGRHYDIFAEHRKSVDTAGHKDSAIKTIVVGAASSQPTVSDLRCQIFAVFLRDGIETLMSFQRSSAFRSTVGIYILIESISE